MWIETTTTSRLNKLTGTTRASVEGIGLLPRKARTAATALMPASTNQKTACSGR